MYISIYIYIPFQLRPLKALGILVTELGGLTPASRDSASVIRFPMYLHVYNFTTLGGHLHDILIHTTALCDSLSQTTEI